MRLTGHVHVVSCVFSNNSAIGGTGAGGLDGGIGGNGDGGAIYDFNAEVLMANSILSANIATGGQGGDGTDSLAGGCQGGPTGANGVVGGGALAVHSGSMHIVNCSISANAAIAMVGGNSYYTGSRGGAAQGGGIFVEGGQCSAVGTTINANFVSGGASASAARYSGSGGAADGGGISVVGGEFSAANVTLSANGVVGGPGGVGNLSSGAGGDGHGGAISCQSGSATLANVTIGDNYAIGGPKGACSFGCSTNGVGFAGGIFAPSGFSVLNTIVARNNTGGDAYGTINSLGNNLFGTTSNATGFVGSDLLNANPNLSAALGANGGPTLTYSFAGASPAINGGTTNGAPPTDQRGVTRPQGSGVDIGAFELETAAILVNGNDGYDGAITSIGPATITLLTAYNNGVLLYTLDGSTPTASSSIYTGPFLVTTSATIRVLAYSSDFSQSAFGGPVQLTVIPVFTLTVVTNGNGGVSIAPLATSYPSNTTVHLVATAAASNMFVNWSGDVSSTSSTIDVVMDSSKVVQANFAAIPKYTVSLQIVGQGTVSVSPNGPYLSNTTVTIVAQPSANWTFTGWDGDASGNGLTNTVVMNANKSVQATFSPLFNLLTTTAGGGSIQVTPSGPYAINTPVTVTATPSNGWTFVQWLGDATGNSPTTNVVMTRNKMIRAVFGTTVSTTASGGGTIQLDPALSSYPYGSVVRASAIPQSGDYFVLWGNAVSGTNNPVTLVVTNPAPGISALFSTLSSGYSLAVVPIGRGTVTASPSANVYTNGQAVTLTATAAFGDTFEGWSGDATGTTNPLAVNMDSSKVIYANFSRKPLLEAINPPSFPEGPQLVFTGEAGSFTVQSSTNLIDWNTVTTFASPGGTVQVNDGTRTNGVKVFYRATSP